MTVRTVHGQATVRTVRVVAGRRGAPDGARRATTRPTATGCARPCSTRSQPRRRRGRRPCSTCSPAAARSASRRCRGARRRAIFVDADRARRRRDRGEPGDHRPRGAGRRSSPDRRQRVPGRAAGGHRSDLVLLDPPYRFDGWDGLLEALGAVGPAGDVVVVESDREVDVPAGLGCVERRSGTAVRSWPSSVRRKPASPSQPESPLTRVLYPGSFDPIHNGHLEIIETASRLFDEVVVAAMRNPQKGEPLFNLDERKAMLEESRRPPRQRQGHHVLEPGRRPGPRGRRRLHRQGPARRLRLRDRAADGPDEPQGSPGSTRSSSRRRRPTRSSPRS